MAPDPILLTDPQYHAIRDVAHLAMDVMDGAQLDATIRNIRARLDEIETPDPEALPLPIAAIDAVSEPPPEYLVQDLIPQREPIGWVSEGGVGKTSTAVEIAVEVVASEHVFGQFPVLRSGPVLIVSGEDSAGVLRNRAEAIARGRGLDVDRVLGGIYLLALTGAQIDVPVWQDLIIRSVGSLGCVLVIFDPYGELTTAKENTDENKTNVRFFRRLIRETGTTVIVSLHAGKDSQEGRKKLDRVRGWSGVNQAMRAVFFLEETGEGIAIECVKMSRAEKPPRFVVRREIEVDPLNRASWITARHVYVTAQQSEDSEAERFILAQLPEGPGREGPNSGQLRSELRTAWNREHGGKVSAAGVAKALVSLGNKIGSEPGTKRNEKLWYRSLPTESQQAGQADLPNLPELARQVEEHMAEPAHTPKGGQAGRPNSTRPTGSNAAVLNQPSSEAA